MQAGKVDIPSTCTVCGANLSNDKGGVCGIACIRAKIAKIKIEDRCSPSCPTWDVFNSETDPILDVCIDCWSDTPDNEQLTMEEMEALPEAQHELALAIKIFETAPVTVTEEEEESGRALYTHPYLSAPCKCGCVVFRCDGALKDEQQEQCSACGELRDLECHCSIPGHCPVCALAPENEREPVAGPPCHKCGSLLWQQCKTGAPGCLHCFQCREMQTDDPRLALPVVHDVSTFFKLAEYLKSEGVELGPVGYASAHGKWFARLSGGAGTHFRVLTEYADDLLTAIKAVIAEWQIGKEKK